MNADQVVEGIGKAVAAAEPVKEICWPQIDGVMCFTKTEWISFIGLPISLVAAVGTLLAVVVSLSLARGSEKKDQERNRRLQRIHAINLLPVLEAVHSDLRLSVVGEIFYGTRVSSIDAVQDRFNRAMSWSEDFNAHSAIESLSPESLLLLPEVPALRISHALGMLRALRLEMARFRSQHGQRLGHQDVHRTLGWARRQSTASDYLRTAIESLRKTARLEAVIPSREEIHGYSDE